MSLFSLIKPRSLFSSNRSLPCLKEAENLQQLLVFLQHKTVEENAHIIELKKYHLQLQQVCVMCICSVHECV